MLRRYLPLLLLVATAALGARVEAQPYHVGSVTEPPWSTQYTPPLGERSFQEQQPEERVRETPVADIIATRLGLTDGTVELFRYRTDNGTADGRNFDGVVDGGGLKLKLTW